MAEVERARTAERLVPEQRQLLARLQEQAASAVELATAREQCAQVGEAHAAAEHSAQQLRATARDVREQRIDAITAELAAALVDDSPCPVCGATEHPDVTQVRADHVSLEQERAADQAADTEALRATDLGRTLAALEGRVDALSDRVGKPGADLEQHVIAAQERLQTLASDASADDADRRLLALQDEAERLGADLSRAEVRAAEEGKRAVEATALAERLRGRLAKEVADGDLVGRLARLAALADAYDTAAARVEAAAATQCAAADAQQTAGQLAGAAGFDSAAAAGLAARSQAWREQTRDELDAHREQLAAVRGRLASKELAVSLEPPAPVELCQTEAAEAAGRHEQAVAEQRLVQERADRLAALVPRYAEARALLGPLRDDAQLCRSLAELAAGRGSNRLSMPLATFVLAARLEQVAEAASLRLSRMSGGRYTLVHTDASRDRRSRAGLGLHVEDSWTGRARDTATLSGGETFMTALSLALGLADVVTAEAGGQRIDTLFVDEGFGTLDADSLDQVMNVLDDLRSGGRLVGVVSHVADLRQRIPAQVRVMRGMRGSRLESVIG
jgi:exonuclease SbcC